MARERKAKRTGEVDVRAALIERFTYWQKKAFRIRGLGEGEVSQAVVALSAQLRHAAGEEIAAEPYTALVAQLEAGEPIEVLAWQLPKPAQAGLDRWDRVRVESDGSLTVVGHLGPGDPIREALERRR